MYIYLKKKHLIEKFFYLCEFQALRLMHEFVILKVDDAEAFPNYPYRDDALLIFEAIYDYVREVLEAFYGKYLFEWPL